MFAVPHAVSVTSGNGATSTAGQLVNNGREKVINALRSQPAFSRSIVTRSDGTAKQRF